MGAGLPLRAGWKHPAAAGGGRPGADNLTRIRHTLRTGKGIVVDTSLLGAATWAPGPDLAYASVTGRTFGADRRGPARLIGDLRSGGGVAWLPFGSAMAGAVGTRMAHRPKGPPAGHVSRCPPSAPGGTR